MVRRLQGAGSAANPMPNFFLRFFVESLLTAGPMADIIRRTTHIRKAIMKRGDKIIIEGVEYLVILVDVENAAWVCIIDDVGRIYQSNGKEKSHRVVDLSDLLD